VPGAWLNHAVFEGPKCRKVRDSYSYFASATSGEADEPCPEGARSGGLLGLADARAGSLGASEDGLLQDGTASTPVLTTGDGVQPRPWVRIPPPPPAWLGEMRVVKRIGSPQRVERSDPLASADVHRYVAGLAPKPVHDGCVRRQVPPNGCRRNRQQRCV